MSEIHKPRYEAVRTAQIVQSLREAKKPHSEEEFVDAHNRLHELGVDTAIRRALSNQIAIDDARFILSLPTKKSGPSITMRFDYDEEDDIFEGKNIILSKGIKIEDVNGDVVISYLKPSSRPEDYAKKNIEEKNAIDQNVNLGGWVVENSQLSSSLGNQDILVRRIEIATMVSGKYFEERNRNHYDSRTVGFTYEKDEDGNFYLHFDRTFEKAA